MKLIILKILALTIYFSMIYDLLSAQSALVITDKNETGLLPGVHLIRIVNTASFLAPLTGKNQKWDYSGLKAGPIYTNSLVGANSFSNTAVADTTAFVTVGGSLVIPATKVYDMDASDFFEAGTILPKQGYSLYATTGGKSDSLFIPAQTLKYRNNYLKFPATYDSTWTSQSVETVNFVINAKSYFLSNAPAKKVTHIIIRDSVVGWGTLSIPSANKASIPYPVLLVKQRTTSIDSFFLLGSPAPAILLLKFNVSQGSVSNDYSEYFYRAGTVEPLLYADYNSDSTYSNASSAYFTADNVESGIEQVNGLLPGLNVYPNPSSSGMINFGFHKNSEAQWHLKFINSLGETIFAKTISETGDIFVSIPLSRTHNSGMYYAALSDENGLILETKKLEIRNQ